ncbi:MAG: LrgB family protein [Eubacteriales bacterium]
MNEMLQQSTYFGVGISIIAYVIGVKVKERWNYPLVNPLLIAVAIVIFILMGLDITYDTYNQGAQYITFLLTPATVCLAVPLYKQIILLQKHLHAILISIFCGCLAHMGCLVILARLFNIENMLLRSLLSKSVTTPIALGVAEEIGGLAPITIMGVVIAGMLGAVIGPSFLRLFAIKEPIAQGLAIGTASHALGTSRIVEEGEIQGAMSSLAIVVAGLLTVVIVPLVVPYL